MIVEVNEEQAREILESESCCYGEGQGGNLSFLLTRIKDAFPELWDEYSYLRGR